MMNQALRTASLIVVITLASCNSKNADEAAVATTASDLKTPAPSHSVSAVAATTAAALPTADEVKAALIAYLNESEDSELPIRKSRIPMPGACGDTTQVPQCLDSIFKIQKYKSQDLAEGTTLTRFKQDIASFDLKACSVDVVASEDCSSQLTEFGDFQSKVAASHYRSLDYVYQVTNIGDYEGTIIAYVDRRAKGNDEWEHLKVKFNRVNNAWVLVE